MHDLSDYDADSWNLDYQLSEEEARIEALCDEERYLALHSDLLEEEARQGEREGGNECMARCFVFVALCPMEFTSQRSSCE